MLDPAQKYPQRWDWKPCTCTARSIPASASEPPHGARRSAFPHQEQLQVAVNIGHAPRLTNVRAHSLRMLVLGMRTVIAAAFT